MNSLGHGLAVLVAIIGLTWIGAASADVDDDNDDDETGTTLTWSGSYESRVGWRKYAFEAEPVRPEENGTPWRWQVRLMDLDASKPQWVELTDVVFEGSRLEFTYPKAHDELRCALEADGHDYEGECVSQAASTIRNRMILEMPRTVSAEDSTESARTESDDTRNETSRESGDKASRGRDKKQ